MEKYSSVIIQRLDRKDFLDNLEILNNAFGNNNFKEVVLAANITNSKKLDFILSFCSYKDISFVNFLKILVMNRSLNKIPMIYQNLLKKIALEQNIFYATIYTVQPLDDISIKKYEEQLSKYFSKNIQLNNKISDKDEVRVCLEELGYEIVISNDTLKRKLKQFIIKAV